MRSAIQLCSILCSLLILASCGSSHEGALGRVKSKEESSNRPNGELDYQKVPGIWSYQDIKKGIRRQYILFIYETKMHVGIKCLSDDGIETNTSHPVRIEIGQEELLVKRDLQLTLEKSNECSFMLQAGEYMYDVDDYELTLYVDNQGVKFQRLYREEP